MKRIIKKQEPELFTQMTYFVDHKNRKITFSKWFMNKVKDMTSNEFVFYVEMMSRLKGYEIVVVNSKSVSI